MCAHYILMKRGVQVAAMLKTCYIERGVDLKQELLMTPGPVNVPMSTSLAEAKPMRHHRGADFAEWLKAIDDKLKRVFKTQNTILYFAASGTGAMEACVVNLLKQNDRPIVIEGGKFGQRWGAICQAFKINYRALEIEWGTAPSPALIEQALRAQPASKIIFTTLFETSTATAYDIENIAKVAQSYDAVLVVDAISGLGAVPLKTDAWGVDVVVAASQKALMAPPGLAFVSISERAWKLVEKSDLPKFYWDFKAAEKELFLTPYTPAISLLQALDESLNIILEEGVDAVLCRYELYAKAVREAVAAMGLKVFSQSPGAVCTAIELPPPIKAKDVRKAMSQDFGIRIAEGQDHLKDRIIRITHIGDLGPKDILGVLAALEITLSKLGARIELGAGIERAMEILSSQVDR